MPPYFEEDFFLKAPCLLAAADLQYLVSPGPGGELLLQEGAGSAWGKPRTLLQQCPGGYSASLDKAGSLHLLTVEQGRFYHLCSPAERAVELPAPFYREEGKECSRLLTIGDSRGTLHLVHPAVDRPAERWWLLHHRHFNGTWEEPRVIDFGRGTAESYGTLALDAKDRLHLVYCAVNEGDSLLCHRRFDPGNARWSSATLLPASSPAAFPSLTLDDEQNLHLLWSAAVEDKHYLYYRFRGGPGKRKPGWTPETAISPALAEAPFPFFTYRSGDLYIAWLEGDSLFRYRFAGDQWEQIPPRHFKEVQLLRVCSFSLEGRPLHYWTALEGDAPAATAAPAAASHADLESDFSRLDRYSGKLIGRIADLSFTKERLQEEVKSRSREMLLLSQKSEKRELQWRKSLEEKDTELQKLQQELGQIIKNLKKKIERGGRAGEAERKRFLQSIDEHKAGQRRLESALRKKEEAIARLEARCLEQRRLIEQLHKEQAPKPRPLLRRFREFWEQIFSCK